MRISELTDGARNVDLDEVECISFGEPREGTTRYGDPYKVIEATIKDDTGEIKLTLWNEDIEKVRVGTKLWIRHGYTNSYLGEVKLNIGRYGRIETDTCADCGYKIKTGETHWRDESKGICFTAGIDF